MLWNALENKGFLSCPAGGICAQISAAAANGGSGSSAGVVVMSGDVSCQEADQ